ncbi:uncharacterized protein VNE69_10137 [Vairimorpha necatrix]|uniref:Uncharacterized protein n=1 Tax=Vairimorpha necatrix TaxID=6039 RepID=A0AAX4JFW6_9MICR
MEDLLLQIKNGQIKNLLEEDSYKLYKYLYKYKLKDPRIEIVLEGIKNDESSNDIEKTLVSLFFMKKIKIENIHTRIYLQEYFPRFHFLFIDSEDIKYQMILQFYFLIKKYKIYETNKKLNNLVAKYISSIRIFKNDLTLYNDKTNTFVLNYNTKQRILKESEDNPLMNCLIPHLSTPVLVDLYDIIEDKSVINLEINNRNLFHYLIDKIVRDTLIDHMNLIDLKVDKKIFYIHLNKSTMIYKKLLERNFKKYLDILKLIKYKKKYVLLVEWLKTFIYFGKFELFKKLYKSLHKKISKEESELFDILRNNLKSKKHFTLVPFLVKCRHYKDSEFCIHSYKDITMKLG